MMAMLASIGFASLHMGDTVAARAAIVTTAAATANQRPLQYRSREELPK